MVGKSDGYIGTYYSEYSKGIYHITFDNETGRMTEPELFYEAHNAKWISLTGDSMVFPMEKQGRAGTCFLQLKDGKVEQAGEILEETGTPCYILQDGDDIYTANYHGGNVMVYHLENGTPHLEKRIENGEKAGSHQILLHDSCIMVPCLEQNRIRMFDKTNGFAPAGELIFPDGTGPRHGIFNRSHTKFYLISEWSNELFVYRVHGMEFTLTQSIPVLQKGMDGNGHRPEGAAIRLTRDEHFLYISVRWTDVLIVFDVSKEEVSILQYYPSGGAYPRDFILNSTEDFLLAVNRFGGGIVSIRRNKTTGLLEEQQYRVSMPEGVALVLVDHTEEVIK